MLLCRGEGLLESGCLSSYFVKICNPDDYSNNILTFQSNREGSFDWERQQQSDFFLVVGKVFPRKKTNKKAFTVLIPVVLCVLLYCFRVCVSKDWSWKHADGSVWRNLTLEIASVVRERKVE